MARTLTSNLQAALAERVTTPGYFAEIAFATTLRLSTRGLQEWNGNSWIARGFTVSGFSSDIATPAQSGRIAITDSDGAVRTVILREGIAGRTVNLWKFYGDAPDDADPVQIFSGAGDAASFDSASGVTSINLVQRGSRELYAPRRFMTRANGFSVLPVAGRIVSFNGENFKLERDRS
jgi:hypothetical protein